MNFIVLDEVDYNINKKNSKYIWHCESKRNNALNEDKKTISFVYLNKFDNGIRRKFKKRIQKQYKYAKYKSN